MVEIFQTILQYPLQFLAGLGISGGAIYGAFSFSKWLISLFTKKSQKAKELKAYIETVLSQSGSEQLSLLYEQTKATLIEMAKEKTLSVIDDGEKALEDENVTPETKTIEQAQTIVEQDIKEETKPKPEKDEDIDYV